MDGCANARIQSFFVFVLLLLWDDLSSDQLSRSFPCENKHVIWRDILTMYFSVNPFCQLSLRPDVLTLEHLEKPSLHMIMPPKMKHSALNLTKSRRAMVLVFAGDLSYKYHILSLSRNWQAWHSPPLPNSTSSVKYSGSKQCQMHIQRSALIMGIFELVVPHFLDL